MDRQIVFGGEARKKLLEGITELADAVGSTLGPHGRTAILSKNYIAPHITKDGVTVAKHVSFDDPVKNLGVQIIQQVASQQVDEAGDGTTTSTILARALINMGEKFLRDHPEVTPRMYIKMLQDAGREIIELLDSMKIFIGERGVTLESIATVAANGDLGIGSMIAKALEQAGKDGHVLVRDSNTTDTQLVQTNGYYFDRGYLSPHFVSKYNQNEIEFEDPLILITENKIEDINDIRNALQIAAPILNDHKQLTKSGRPLVVVAEDVVGDALAFMVRNHLGGFVNCVAIKAPGIRNSKKEYLEDMAILTGATMISKEKGRALHKAKEEHLGTCKRIIINKEYTTIIGAVDALPFEDMKVTREAKIQERCQLIRTRLERATDMERPSLAERLARLTGGISLLYVGGNSDIEVKEKKDRIDDAIRATKCAFEDGVILGGGLSLLEISRVLASNMEVDEHGNIMPIYSNFISALIEVLQTPFETILKNGHIAPESVNLEEYAEELRNDLIYDPVKVVKKSIENSFSIAALFLNTDVVIAPKSIDTETAILDMAEQAKVRF